MKAQRGISALGLLFLLIVGGFVFLCLLKIGPLYYNNYKLDKVFQRIGTEGIPIESQTAAEIRNRLSSQFSVDGIRNISPRDIEIERRNGEATLYFEYEDRVNLFGNLDVIVQFENRFTTADEEDN